MEKWIDEAFARACEKMERGAKRAAEQGIIPYMGQKDGYSPAPYDGNSWWTGGFWPDMMWQLYAATGRDVYKDEALLAGRFNPTSFIRAWPQADRAGYAIIDCMMNLSLLYWVLEKPGGQGYAPGSSWNRGQAWALYGFTLSGINTGDRKYIDVARKCAKYFIANIREDGLTDCDFRQPKDEERIDNIAGACAACGLLELANVVGGEEAETYRAATKNAPRRGAKTRPRCSTAARMRRAANIAIWRKIRRISAAGSRRTTTRRPTWRRATRAALRRAT